MIIGNSMDATYYKVFRSLDDSGETLKLDWYNDAFNIEHDDEENYYFVGNEVIPYIEDSWDKSKYYSTNDINLLIECDFCGDHFVTTESFRIKRESRFRKTLNTSGKQTEYGESYLYKDHCKKCKYDKIQETMMITQGFSNPFLTEESRVKRAKSYELVNEVKTSRGQRYLADIFQGELNKLIGYYFADIVIDNRIIIEYDGGGHDLQVKMGTKTQEEFDKNERIREQYLINKGYKILRFVSESDYFPEESKLIEIISESIANLYLTDSNITYLTMSKTINDKNYGKLKHIKQILEQSQFGGNENEN